MGRTVVALLTSVLLSASSLLGQQPTLVVENGRVVTCDGAVLEEASVAVAGDSILAVTWEPVEAPDAVPEGEIQRLRQEVSSGAIPVTTTLSAIPLLREGGKLADLIVVDGNPLEDLSALVDVEVVVQGGEVVAGRPAGR